MKTKSYRRAIAAAALLSAAVITGVGCEKIDVLTDCQQICDRYEDCFDADYDVSHCRSRCDENADAEAFADKVDSCETCMDDRTCASSAFACDSQCSGIVP